MDLSAFCIYFLYFGSAILLLQFFVVIPFVLLFFTLGNEKKTIETPLAHPVSGPRFECSTSQIKNNSSGSG
jgi:hypothetical protein